MKACVLESLGQLTYKEVETPKPKEGEVLLQVRACGICSSDIDRVFKTGAYHFPIILGHEFSGDIVEVGTGTDRAYLGHRAVVFPLLPCFNCPSCSVGAYMRCEQYSYFGSRCDGAFAEYIAVPEWNLSLFSDNVSYESAAMCEPAAVALHAVTAAEVVPGETVAIIGSGTIGLIAAMWFRIQGARQVIIIGRGIEKLKMAHKLGFEYGISSLTQEPEQEIRRLTNGRGVDVVLEAVGNSVAINTAVSCVRKGGKVILTGNPEADVKLDRNVYWKILRGELNLRGTWNSNYNAEKNDWTVVLDYMEKGLLPVQSLITNRFSLDKGAEAFNFLRDNRGLSTKVMFVMKD